MILFAKIQGRIQEMVNKSTAIRKYRLFIFCVVFLLAFALPQLFAAEEYGSDESDAKKILIAYENSSFKKKVLSALITELQDDFHIRTVIHHQQKEFFAEEADTYDAIIIINAGVNSRVRPHVAKWLEDAEDTEKIILLTTYRDKGWEPKYPEGVDSITSPSRSNVVDTLVDDIVEKTKDIVS